MSSTLLRFGLWLVVIIMGIYVVRESYHEQPFAELVPDAMLQHAMVFSVVLVIAGILLRVLEKGSKVVSRNRCRVCKTAIPDGGIYCRAHLRHMLDLEDRRAHSTRIR